MEKNVTAYCQGTSPAVTNKIATLLEVNTIIVAVVALDTLLSFFKKQISKKEGG